jgi:hypothetical protein
VSLTQPLSPNLDENLVKIVQLVMSMNTCGLPEDEEIRRQSASSITSTKWYRNSGPRCTASYLWLAPHLKEMVPVLRDLSTWPLDCK